VAQQALPDNVGRDLSREGPVVAGRKRRRPSGEAPPLPHELRASGRSWLILAGLAALLWVLFLAIGSPAGLAAERVDVAILRRIEDLRASWLTPVMRAIDALGSDWSIRIMRTSTFLALLFFKRFRHLFVFLGAVIGVGWLVTTLNLAVARPRPLGIDMIGHWEGFSNPSRPVAVFAVTLVGIIYSLVVPGRPRSIAKYVIGVLIGALCIARLYLGVDHLTDVLTSVILGVSVPLVAFRMITPNTVFPVTYNKRSTAHLDVGGRRGEAIRRALEDQLGLDVAAMKPFGLAGSGGSTPLRLTLAGQPGRYLFAKLYAANHLRSDRWYKLGRTLLYGRLEDERSFSTVRRLVQYEDYLLRVMRDAGLPTPVPYGFVEITPEREYLIVTEFFDGSKELLEADVDEEIIDQGLATVRAMWDAGIAHRDVKPSNLLVRDGKVYLIDVAFGQVRPSPWRQAVDLANMMLVLALRSDAKQVYERALHYFTPEEIAEAFAATHSVTMPSQSRGLLKKDRRDLVAEFCRLAPKRDPISIQTWSWRRVALTAGVLGVAALLTLVAASNLEGVGIL
jgi:tRNA A-37 threonylcarbamoyl transferase component Bud32/membrane-associated phospholipid phosphatase